MKSCRDSLLEKLFNDMLSLHNSCEYSRSFSYSRYSRCFNSRHITHHEPFFYNRNCGHSDHIRWDGPAVERDINAEALAWQQMSEVGPFNDQFMQHTTPDSKVHGANMGPTWVLSAPNGPHVGPTSLAIRGSTLCTHHNCNLYVILL